mgnify:CR=1 FL=1
MCQTRNSRYVEIIPKKRYVRVDGCLEIAISNLNFWGIKTLSCCCGHGRYPMSIVIKAPLGNFELFSGEIINRKKKFYKLDKEGFYYIPEV